MIAQVNDGDVADGGAGIGADGDMKEEACGVQEVAEDVACIVGAMKGSLKILYCAPSCGGVQKYSRNHPGSSSPTGAACRAPAVPRARRAGSSR
jgi:hypothetical protein